MYNNAFEGRNQRRLVMATVEETKSKKAPTVLRTFRLSSTLDDALTKDAARRNIGKNALITSILEKYVAWDSPVSDFGYLDVPGELVGKLLGAVDKETIYSIAKQVGKRVASSIPLWYGAANLESLLNYMETSVKYSGARLPNRIFRDAKTIRAIVYQPFNENGSAWARGFNTSLVENVLGYPPKIVEHSDSIETIIEVRENS
jgi:hypothetical protein